MASRTSPPKPWEVRKTSSSSSSVPISSTVAQSALEPTDPGNSGLPVEKINPNTRNPHIGGSTNPTSSAPLVPPRPGGSTLSGYNSSYNSPYSGLGSRYGSYGGYGNSGYGSNYGGYGSNYGGYGRYGSYGQGSNYGSYGSGYGGYGSNYGSYGSNYGSYGSYGGYGNSYGRYGYGYRDGGQQPGGIFQNMLDGGNNQMNRFGSIVESFSRFSHLLDANFDALHGSFASVLRFLDVFGEFFYVVRTFAVFRLLFGGLGRFWKILNLMIGRNVGTKKITLKETEGLQVDDYKNFQASQGNQVRIPTMFVIFGILAASLPLLMVRLWRSFHNKMKMLEGMESEMDTLWSNEPPKMLARAKFSFQGETEMDLPFRQGDVIRILGKPFPDWWEGEINGRKGLFPANFVEEETSELKK